MIFVFWIEKIGESYRVDFIRFDGFMINLVEDFEIFGGRVWLWEGCEDFGWFVGDFEGYYVYIYGVVWIWKKIWMGNYMMDGVKSWERRWGWKYELKCYLL